VDLTAAGPGLGQLAGQLEGGTVFEGYTDATLQLGGCKVVGLLVEGQPVASVSGEGEGTAWMRGGSWGVGGCGASAKVAKATAKGLQLEAYDSPASVGSR
jgi:hypothetical protein